MSDNEKFVERKPNRFHPDFKRVIIRFYNIDIERSEAVIRKVIEMDEMETELTLTQVLREFAWRHRNITRKFLEHFEKVKELLDKTSINFKNISQEKKLLIGSYFSMEFSIEAAAFFNPSIVEAPDQTGLEKGSKRIIVSFRATGEGHVSSVVFHTGIIDHSGNMEFSEKTRYIDEPEIIYRHHYDKDTFISKLREMKVNKDIIDLVFKPLGKNFIFGELQKSVNEVLEQNNFQKNIKRSIKEIIWLADSHYEITFSRDTVISERVIFPVSFSELKGIEDTRFVRFIDDDGLVIYYATYTAFDGYTILPKLILTRDFYHFEIKPLHGKGAQNKNLALFPRKINGKYVMLSRIDGINSFIDFSDNINIWNNPVKIKEPRFPWEYIQIGNCGSPIETSEGWLVINHGVGPVRKYCLGASLLDLNDPAKEIGRLKEPLLMPNADEREGYVPNVVYSCGSLVHNDKLIIPYGLSDTSSGFVSVDMDELIKRIKMD